MTISYSRISKSSFNEIEFNMHGDDISTVLIIDLTDPPFNLNFNGRFPSQIEVDTREAETITATASIASDINGHAIMTTVFSIPPDATVPLGPTYVLHYDSL